METNKVTELVLENIEKLLLEGRVENVKKKYPEPMWSEVDKLVEADPSGNNKFLEWLAKHMLPKTIKWFKDNAGESNSYWSWTIDQVPDVSQDDRWRQNRGLDRSMQSLNSSTLKNLADDLEHFLKNPSKYEIKDINQFDSIDAFQDAADTAKQKLSRKEMKETGVDKVFEDDRFILLMPKTHKASCRYGARTRWCVTMRDYSGYFENYFGQGPIFFLIDKSQPARSYSPSYMQEAENYWKVALHYRPFNGRLDGGGNRALQYSKQMSREEFIDGGNIGNTHIDYWNVRDDNKKESVVAKYLGGPGRGQTQRAQVILNNLKGAMERYTKKALADYYDSLGNSDEVVEKIQELNDKREELANNRRSVNNKRDRLSQARRSLSYFKDRLDTDETDDEYREWVEEQLSKSTGFIDELDELYTELQTKIEEVDEEIGDLEEKLSDKKLAFYDKEKNVPLGR
jgi:hypothetical protein